MELNGKKVFDVELDGVKAWDAPDFCDAYFSYAVFEDGTALTDEELDALYEKYPDRVNEMAMEKLY